MPRMAEMLKIFDPNAFPIDKAAPPDKEAVKATVISGRVVDSEMRVNPMEVLPSLLMAATFVAYLIVMSLAKFRNTKATAMNIKLMMKSILSGSAMFLVSERFFQFCKA
jgi:hypothetical protein